MPLSSADAAAAAADAPSITSKTTAGPVVAAGANEQQQYYAQETSLVTATLSDMDLAQHHQQQLPPPPPPPSPNSQYHHLNHQHHHQQHNHSRTGSFGGSSNLTEGLASLPVVHPLSQHSQQHPQQQQQQQPVMMLDMQQQAAPHHHPQNNQNNHQQVDTSHLDQESGEIVGTIDQNGQNAHLLDSLKLFLATAPTNWDPDQTVKRFPLPNGEYISCVLWNNLFHITGTDIVRSLTYRFQGFGRPVKNVKKFEEGVFSDLRNLKPGIDATLEDPRSEFLEMLYKSNCIRTQKKQKVFYWFSVPHDRLFMDALERDLKREALGVEPTTVATNPMPLIPTLELAKQQCLPTLQFPKSEDLLESSSSSSLTLGPAAPPPPPQQQQQHMAGPSSEGGGPGGPVALEEWIHDSPVGQQIHQQQHQLYAPQPQQPQPHPLAQSQDFTTYDPNHQQQQQIPYLTHASPPLPHASPSLSSVTSEDPSTFPPLDPGQQPPYPLFSLFEGSPNYKQRRRAQSLFSISKPQHTPPPYGPRHATPDPPEKRNYTCTFDGCSRRFKRYEHLRRHERCHTGERPYVCPVDGCAKGFSRSDNLAQHMRVHSSSLAMQPQPQQAQHPTAMMNKPDLKLSHNSSPMMEFAEPFQIPPQPYYPPYHQPSHHTHSLSHPFTPPFLPHHHQHHQSQSPNHQRSHSLPSVSYFTSQPQQYMDYNPQQQQQQQQQQPAYLVHGMVPNSGYTEQEGGYVL